MTSKERELTAAIGTSVLVFGWYFTRAYGAYRAGAWEAPNALAQVATQMLIAIGISIVVQIGLTILLAIAVGIAHGGTPPDAPVDERDRWLAMRSETGFAWLSGFGFVLGLAALMLGASGPLALHVMLLGMILSHLAAGAMHLLLSRRGG